MDRIRGFQHDGRTIVLVTHSLDQVLEICDRAVVLDHGSIIADGEPRDALRALRSEYDQIRQDELAHQREAAETVTVTEATPAAAVAPPAAEVTAIEVLDTAGDPVDTVRPGDDLVVRVHLRADDPVTNGFVGIAIENTMGLLLYGTNSKLLGVPLPTLSGESSFSFTLPGLSLGDGSLVVHAAISSEEGTELHRLREGAVLASVTDDSSIGLVWTKPLFARLDA